MNPIKTRKILLHGKNSIIEQLQFEYKDQWHDIKDASEVPGKIKEIDKPKKKGKKK